jgi:hypothetical protein
LTPATSSKQLKGIGGPSPVWENGTQILSTPDAIAKALEWYLDEREGKKKAPGSQPNFSLYDVDGAAAVKVPVETPGVKNQEAVTLGHSRKISDNCENDHHLPECGSNVIIKRLCDLQNCGFSKCS